MVSDFCVPGNMSAKCRKGLLAGMVIVQIMCFSIGSFLQMLFNVSTMSLNVQRTLD